jgi:hypothetical protein
MKREVVKLIALTSLFCFYSSANAVEFSGSKKTDVNKDLKSESQNQGQTSATAESEDKKTSSSVNHYFYICKNQKVVRTLRMDKKSANCQAIYTKDGVDKVIGSAQKTFSCVEVLDGVKKTLTDAGWKCKEVKGEQISTKIDLSTE